MIGKEILIIADGNFSFTTAYLKLLSEKLTQSRRDDYYEVISSELEVSNAEEIKKNILSTLKIDSKVLSLKICEIDAHAISPKTFGGGKRFDEIILNFPTPFLRGKKLEIDRFFEQIIRHNLLKEDGVLKLTYWQKLYDNGYEDAYEIMPSAKKYDLKLIYRDVFDYALYAEFGYKHVLHTGEESDFFEENLPITACFKRKISNKKLPLQKIEYTDFTDDEDVTFDAMLFRPKWPILWDTQYNNFSKSLKRSEYMKEKIEKEPSKYTEDEIFKLAKDGKWREVDKRLKVLVDSGTMKNRWLDQYSLRLCKLIKSSFEKLENFKEIRLDDYCAFPYWGELKVLTGVHIPRTVPNCYIRRNWN